MAPAAPLNHGVETAVEEFVYTSKLPDIEISNHLPLHAYCFQRLREVRERPCIVEGRSGKVYSYGQVDSISRKVAAGLAKLGIGHGQVVMLLLPNCPEFACVFLGASYRGAIATTANPFYTPAEIAKQITASNARLVVTKTSYVDKLCDVVAREKLYVVTIDSPAEGCEHISLLTEADENGLGGVEIRPDDVVALPYSSGTTRLPKGVMLTHKCLVSSIAQQAPPAELEGILVKHPSIADAAVVSQKDEVAGEVPVAFVVRSDGHEMGVEEVKQFVAKQEVFYKKLHSVSFIDVIHKSPSGKICARI